MTDLASQTTQQVRVEAPPPCSWSASVRRAAASFWLNHLFLSARYTPWYVRGTKPFFMWWAWNCSRHLRDTTLANARWLLGDQSSPEEREALGKRIVGSFYDFVYDVGRSAQMSVEQLRQQIAGIEGTDAYRAARACGRGVILATAHMGSFEVGMAALLQIEKRIHVVFQRDANDAFEGLRRQLHQRMGILEAPVDEGWTIWMRLRDALANDDAVAIQADRVMPGQKGQRVPFMGGHTMLPVGPVKLAMISGAPIVPVFALRQPDGKVRIVIEEPIFASVSDAGIHPALLRLAGVIEKHVRANPHQWLVLHRAWCEDAEEPTA